MRVREGFDAVSPHASVIAHTEFANDTRASILKTAATKAAWGFFQNNVKPYDECCFTWDTKVWRHLDDAARVISAVPWYSASTGHQMAEFTAVAVLLEHQGDGSRWVLVTLHTPSHVAVWGGWRPSSNRLRCYHDGITDLGRWVTVLDKKWPQHAMVVTADWNAPCEQPWFRNYLEAHFPVPFKVAAPNTSHPPYPDTHDSRCIDWAVLGGNVAKYQNARTLKVPDSDHLTVVLPLRLNKEPS